MIALIQWIPTHLEEKNQIFQVNSVAKYSANFWLENNTNGKKVLKILGADAGGALFGLAAGGPNAGVSAIAFGIIGSCTMWWSLSDK